LYQSIISSSPVSKQHPYNHVEKYRHFGGFDSEILFCWRTVWACLLGIRICQGINEAPCTSVRERSIEELIQCLDYLFVTPVRVVSALRCLVNGFADLAERAAHL
jgi:hypothetical protein